MSNHQQFESKIKALRQCFDDALPHRLQSIESCWVRLCTINWSQSLLARLATMTKQLAASTKTFGEERLRMELNELEDLLAGLLAKGLPAGSEEKHRIDKKILQLASAAGTATAQAEPHRTDPPCSELIYLLDPDLHSLSNLNVVLQSTGFRVKMFGSMRALFHAVKEQLPAIVCLDMVLAEGKQAGITVVEKLLNFADSKIQFVFVASRGDMVARLKALRCGAQAFFVKPIDEAVVRDRIVDIVGSQLASHVLLVGADKHRSDYNLGLLTQAGYRVEQIADPIEALRVLHYGKPDLIVTDYKLTHCSGTELAAVLQEDERYSDIPVLLLNEEQDEDIAKKAYEIFGNGCLSGAFDDKVLLTTVEHIIARSKQLHSRINTVSVSQQLYSGVMSCAGLFSEVDMAIANVGITDVVKHLLMIDIDRRSYLQTRFGLKIYAELVEQIEAFLHTRLAANSFALSHENNYLMMTAPMLTNQAVNFSEDICRAIADRTFVLNGNNLKVTLSIGLTGIDHQTRSLEQCVGYCGEAIKLVAGRGGNGVAMCPEPIAAASRSTGLFEARVMQAIEKQSFKLVFQAVVNLDESEKLYECRVRLIESENNLLLPDQFLPFIFKHRLHLDLDRWVIRKTVTTLASLSGLARQEVNLIVKVTPDNYRFEQISSFAANLVNSSGIKGQHRLILQIDEKWAISHQITLRRQIERLNSVGIGFILDHAGASDYSIDLIRDICPNMVKLDSSLMADFTTSGAARKRLTDLLDLANSKGVRVIAGTVEDAKLFASLWGIGVRYFQGYFIQQPGHSLDFDFHSFNYG